MRRVMQWAALSSLFVGFMVFSLYRGFRDPADNYFRFPQPPPDSPADSPNEAPSQLHTSFGDVGLLEGLRVQFEAALKNPCWVGAADRGEAHNYYTAIIKQPHKLKYERPKGNSDILRCLPYFYLAGMPKCGTTDIFHRIHAHPDVLEPAMKGPHWWTRERYGVPYALRPVPFKEYLELFNYPAMMINKHFKANQTTHKKTTLNNGVPRKEVTNEVTEDITAEMSRKITGDGSTSTFWDSWRTMTFLHATLGERELQQKIASLIANRNSSINLSKTLNHPNRNKPITNKEKEKRSTINRDRGYQCCAGYTGHRNPEKDWDIVTYGLNDSAMVGAVLPVSVADVIHAVNPRAKIILSVREPVARLYSSYLFFSTGKVSPEMFDVDARRSVAQWRNCTARYSVRTCAYNKTLQRELSVRLYGGLYSVFLCDWLRTFPAHQVLVVRMEDYHQDMLTTLKTIYSHLELRDLSKAEEELVVGARIRNKSTKKHIVGKMLNTTREFLQEFYQQFNRDLADLLADDRFLWRESYPKFYA